MTIITIAKLELNKSKLENVLIDNAVLCNIYYGVSIVYNKKLDCYNRENMARIEIFNINYINLKIVWLNIKLKLGLNCCWVDINDKNIHSCITKIYNDIGQCSEY